MSLITLPGPSTLLVSKLGTPTIDWYRYLRDLRRIIGCDSQAPIYEDLVQDPLAGHLISTAAKVNLVGSTYVVSCLAAADSGIAFNIRLPRNYRAGSTVFPWLEWTKTAAAGADTVRWRFRASVPVGEGDVIADSYTDNETDTTDGAAQEVQRVKFASMALTAERGDTLLCQLLRLSAGGGDTHAGYAGIVACGLTIEIDGVGNEAGTA